MDELLEAQAALQQMLGQPMGLGEKAIKENILALIVEGAETLNEINWKLWRKGPPKKVSRETLLEEIADMQIFLLNIWNAAGVQPGEAQSIVHQKQVKVYERYCQEISARDSNSGTS